MSKVVYIRGMEKIPDECLSCYCCFDGIKEFFCAFIDEPITFYATNGLRSEYCPLREMEVLDDGKH